jgi:N-acetylornithine carbamoyltransferase
MAFQIDENNLITDQEWSVETINRVLEDAADIKAHPETYYDTLLRKSLCLYFFNPSLRTRNSFEVGINQMGGHASFVSAESSWLGQDSESVKDTASVLSRYFDLIAIRMFPNAVDWEWCKSNHELREFAKWSRVPVINMEDDTFHPCQALTDAYTIQEALGGIQGKKITISWVYHPKPLPMSVPNSILLITTRLGMDVIFARPDEHYDLAEDIMETASQNASESGGKLTISNDIDEACDGADVIYAKAWGSKDFYGDPKAEKQIRMKYRGENGKAWQMTGDRLARASEGAKFMHCLPVRRNIEVADEVMDSPNSIAYDEAENRMHVQKAVMKFLMGKNDPKA